MIIHVKPLDTKSYVYINALQIKKIVPKSANLEIVFADGEVLEVTDEATDLIDDIEKIWKERCREY